MFNYTIEYYSTFQWVILVFGVGYQCVTLPFAMPILLLAFDLHALDTPPAFILSQDQTLFKKFFFRWLLIKSFRFYIVSVFKTEKFFLSELMPISIKIIFTKYLVFKGQIKKINLSEKKTEI
jgi:hypothetical protein